jgi:hypothetical protein
MRRTLNLTAILFLFLVQAQAQVTIETERDKDNNVNFYAINTAEIPYSVLLNFSDLQNMTTSAGGKTLAVAIPGRSKVATLRPTLAGQGSNFRYSFSFAKGNVYAKSKQEVAAYLLPVPDGTSVKAVRNNTVEGALGQANKQENYAGVTLFFDKPTQITAPRKGLVAALKMDGEPVGTNLSYVAEENFIELYHEDGTLTRLSVLKAGTEQVKLGQLVFPGDPLALSGGENYSQGPQTRILQLRTLLEENRFLYRPFPVTYMTDQGPREIKDYTTLVSAHPQELITIEMSKRELKAYLERK